MENVKISMQFESYTIDSKMARTINETVKPVRLPSNELSESLMNTFSQSNFKDVAKVTFFTAHI